MNAIIRLLEHIAVFLGNLLTKIIEFLLTLLGIETAFFETVNYVRAVNFFFYTIIQIFFLLALVIFVVSIIRTFYPPEKIRRLLGEKKANGIRGSIVAALLGVVTPFCSCSAITVTIGLVHAGIPLAFIYSFLIASPLISEVGIVLLWSMFGWKLALVYLATGIIIAVVSATVINKLNMEKYVEDYSDISNVKLYEDKNLKWNIRIKFAGNFVLEIIGRTWLYIVISIFISSILHGWIPEGWISDYAGTDNPFSVIIVVLLGIPMFSNAAGIVPVIGELTRLGMPIGTAMAFMMSSIALSLPAIILLRNVFKFKLLLVLVGIIALAIILSGYLINIFVVL